MNSTIKKFVFSFGMLALITSVNSCGRAVSPVATQFHSVPQQLRSQNVNTQAPQILVQFHSNAGRQELQNFNQKYGLQTLNYIPGINAYVMGVNQLASGQELQFMLANMSREAAVRTVEVNGEMGLFAR